MNLKPIVPGLVALSIVDEEYYAESGLRPLLEYFSREYPSPDALDVCLYSDLAQVRAFVGGRPFHPAELLADETNPITPWNRYAEALLSRRANDVSITYNIAGGERVTISVDGRDR